MIDQLKSLLKYGQPTQSLKLCKGKSGLYRFIYDNAFDSPTHLEIIVCLIDERCVRLNSVYRLSGEFEPILHDFAEKHGRAFKIINLSEARAQKIMQGAVSTSANWMCETPETTAIEPDPIMGIPITGQTNGTDIIF